MNDTYNYKYEITMRANETWVEFCTRIANEIQTMTEKIVCMDIDIRTMTAKITYHR